MDTPTHEISPDPQTTTLVRAEETTEHAPGARGWVRRRAERLTLAQLPTPATLPEVFTGPLLALSALAVVLVYLEAWGPLPGVWVDRVPVGLSLLPSAALLGVVFWRWALRGDDAVAAVLPAVMLVLLAVALRGLGGGLSTVGLVAAAAAEEGTFRIGVLLLVVAAVHRVRPARTPVGVSATWALAVAAQAVSFTFMPGHLQQMPGQPLVALGIFGSVSLLFLYLVWPMRSPVTAVLVHAVVNAATFGAVSGELPTGLRAAAVWLSIATVIVLDVRRTLRDRPEVLARLRAVGALWS